MRLARLIRLAFITLAVSGAAGATGAELKAGTFTPPRVAPDFRLPGSDGHDVTMSQYRGKVVLLAFGYTSCTEVCPITLAVLARARKALGAAASQLQVIYVTVDPERDTPARMHQYLLAFDPSFVGGSGTPTQLATVRKDYGITATRLSVAGGYAYSHSSFVYLVDRGGRLRALMPYGRPADDFVHDVQLLLTE